MGQPPSLACLARGWHWRLVVAILGLVARVVVVVVVVDYVAAGNGAHKSVGLFSFGGSKHPMPAFSDSSSV